MSILKVSRDESQLWETHWLNQKSFRVILWWAKIQLDLLVSSRATMAGSTLRDSQLIRRTLLQVIHCRWVTLMGAVEGHCAHCRRTAWGGHWCPFPQWKLWSTRSCLMTIPEASAEIRWRWRRSSRNGRLFWCWAPLIRPMWPERPLKNAWPYATKFVPGKDRRVFVWLKRNYICEHMLRWVIFIEFLLLTESLLDKV